MLELDPYHNTKEDDRVVRVIAHIDVQFDLSFGL